MSERELVPSTWSVRARCVASEKNGRSDEMAVWPGRMRGHHAGCRSGRPRPCINPRRPGTLSLPGIAVSYRKNLTDSVGQDGQLSLHGGKPANECHAGMGKGMVGWG